MSTLVIAYKQQISSLKAAIEMMEEDWGIYTNQPGFEFCESKLAKSLAQSNYVSPWGEPGCFVKPVLKDMYIAMTNEMISSLERKIKELEHE